MVNKQSTGFSKELVKETKQAKNVARKNLKNSKKLYMKNYPTLNIVSEKDIAMDFAAKAYQKFDKIIKSIVLFGSSVKKNATASSDIDIVIIIDDASLLWDQELIAWYREELGKLIKANPYKKDLHVNTIKLTIWWYDLMQGDPVVINVIRYGQTLIDFGGFFTPLKVLLEQGKIRSTPEAIYTALQRAPEHLARSKAAELGAIEGVYWAMVDSAHAALIAANQLPPSPEHIPLILKETFIDKKMLDMKYAIWYRDLYALHRSIVHGDIKDLKGSDIDDWQKKADEFVITMSNLIGKILE